MCSKFNNDFADRLKKLLNNQSSCTQRNTEDNALEQFLSQSNINLSNVDSFQNIDNVVDSWMVDLEKQLGNLDNFDNDIQTLLAGLDPNTMDLSSIQTQIILLIKNYLSKSKEHKKYQSKLNEKEVINNLTEVSDHIMHNRSKIIHDTNAHLEKSDNHNAFLHHKSMLNIKNIIKMFTIYQVYKAANPRRLAGETKYDNFIHNAVIRGIDKAIYYSNATKSDIAKYSVRTKKINKKLQKSLF